MFIADPQLVDPHTYPGRPWPLSTLTIHHTDLYLRRSYSLLQRTLHPDTVFFLGDLFDGGREWATDRSRSEEKQWRKYGEKYWLREYNRFGRIFFDHWGDGGIEPGAGQQGRKIISGLPGNHDLGLGRGIQLPVRDRFKAYFGDGSRIDIVANHTFVSVDTVSLSAMDQPDQVTGSQGVGLGSDEGTKAAIWKPVQEFLDQAQAEKRRAVERHMKLLNNQTLAHRFDHAVKEMDGMNAKGRRTQEVAVPDLPTVLLTHVPLYRAPGTPCGPQREHWPPSQSSVKDNEPLSVDEPNAIAVRAGYQYQNVLTPTISRDLIEKIGNVGNVFSGDDHDYCEVIHRQYTASSMGGRIREITVKSMSWAMGVRKPGFLMLTLWNPIDNFGKPVGSQSPAHDAAHGGGASATLQPHLCLLPDQLGIFTRYAALLGLTLTTLIIRSVVKSLNGEGSPGAVRSYADDPLLPISRSFNHPTSSAENEKAKARYCRQRADSQRSSGGLQSSNSSTSSNSDGLTVRSATARTRSLSPGLGYGIPVSQTGGLLQADHNIKLGSSSNDECMIFDVRDHDKFSTAESSRNGWHSKRKIRVVLGEAFHSIWRVGGVALAWYIWLAWHG